MKANEPPPLPPDDQGRPPSGRDLGAAPSAEILAFPLVRRRRFIRRQARELAHGRGRNRARYLANQIAIQKRALLSRGIDPTVVETECAALEAAIIEECGLGRSSRGEVL